MFHPRNRLILKRLLLPVLVLSPLLLTGASHGLSSDRDQPINLEADHADIDDLKGVSIYTGNVVLTQGTMVIHSDKLTLFHNKDKELEKAIAEANKGKQATFKQKPDGNKPDIHAKALTMEYYISTDKIHLLKDALLWQGGDRFRGDKIIYDTKKDTVVASSAKPADNEAGEQGKNRVQVTIQPKSKDNNKANSN